MHFAILRPVQVTTDAGDALPLAPLARRVLATLIASGRRGVTPTEMMEAVWGDAHQRESSLKSQVSHLRKVLGTRLPAGGAGGYRFQFETGDTWDVDEFRQATAESDRHRRDGDLRQAVRLLQEALDLWGYPPLPDVSTESKTLAVVRDGLLLERQAAQIALFQMRLDLGEHRQILGDLRAEVALQPTSEQLHGLLMTALYRSGFRQDALQHYDVVTALLERVTGTVPGYQLRQLREEIATDAGTAAPPSAAAPPAVPVPERHGVPLAQLPPTVRAFVGRGSEIADIVDYLTPAADSPGVPIVAVCGPPGVGKSALAVHVAHLLRAHYPGGQVFVAMDSMSERPRDVADVLAELLVTLGLPAQDMPRTVGERSSLLRSMLSGRRILFVLDDVAAFGQMRPLLPGTGDCGVIVTSRPHLSGEVSMRTYRLAPLGQDESLDLLASVVGRQRVQAELAAAAQVVAACGGLPLAVRIAGARLSSQPGASLAYLASRLQDRLSALAVDDMAVEASIADSHTALPEELRRVFRAVALAGPGDFPAWLVTMLLGLEQHGGADALLERLVGHSLLDTAGVDVDGALRYRQHALLREYAAAQLAEHVGERDAVVQRLLLGWLELVALADGVLPREPYHPPAAALSMRLYAPERARSAIQADPEVWLSAEIGNLLMVVRFAAEEGWYQLGAGIALRLAPWLARHSRWTDAEDMWRHIMHASLEARNPRLAGEARLRLAAIITRRQDGARRALPLLDACVDLWEQLADRNAGSRALSLRAHCYVALAADADQVERRQLAGRAIVDCERALELAREADDSYAVLLSLRTLGLAYSRHGDHEHAIRQCEEACSIAHGIARETGEQSYLVFVMAALARTLMASGRSEDALGVVERAQEAATRLQHPLTDARLLELAGDALQELGRHSAAVDSWMGAISLVAGDSDELAELRERCRGKASAALR